MLDALWLERVTMHGRHPDRADLLIDIAARMSERETMWLPAAMFEGKEHIIAALQAAEMLVRDPAGIRIGFAHQTLLDHARSRGFVRDVGRLSDFVKTHQDGLFLRPRLWNALTYLRGADEALYRQELNRLLSADLRLHIRFLLIDFFGGREDPGPAEIEWMRGMMQDAALAPRICRAVAGQRRWFEVMTVTDLPDLMDGSDGIAWASSQILRAALPLPASTSNAGLPMPSATGANTRLDCPTTCWTSWREPSPLGSRQRRMSSDGVRRPSNRQNGRPTLAPSSGDWEERAFFRMEIIRCCERLHMGFCYENRPPRNGG